jgi:hypothetical protein
MNILMEKKKSKGIKGQVRVGKGIIDYSFEKLNLEKSSVSKRGFQLETHFGTQIRQWNHLS